MIQEEKSIVQLMVSGPMNEKHLHRLSLLSDALHYDIFVLNISGFCYGCADHHFPDFDTSEYVNTSTRDQSGVGGSKCPRNLRDIFYVYWTLTLPVGNPVEQLRTDPYLTHNLRHPTLYPGV